MAHAACHGTDPNVFYPDDGQRFAAEIAKAICALCPVRLPCLDHALDHGGSEGRYGVWGGMTETERRKEARRRRAALAVQPARRAG